MATLLRSFLVSLRSSAVRTAASLEVVVIVHTSFGGKCGTGVQLLLDLASTTATTAPKMAMPVVGMPR